MKYKIERDVGIMVNHLKCLGREGGPDDGIVYFDFFDLTLLVRVSEDLIKVYAKKGTLNGNLEFEFDSGERDQLMELAVKELEESNE